ncbi:MAG: ABC-2 family transporter protein [Verrucomicrobia bacterium]|nr:ABC-2 family transporter protein [Verrucomicrobiota bacterium]
MSELKNLWAHIKISIQSTVSLRESFLIQSFFMLLSNLVFFSFWWIYFSNFKSIKGWTLSDIACLYGIVNGAYGIFSVFFGGSRYLARMIFEGDLDMLIVKPKNLLLQIMGSKSVSSGWGDIFSSAVFLAFSGYATLTNLPLLALFILTACLVITSFSIVMGSLAFWIGDSHSLSKQLFEFLLTFSNYPKSIYVGAVKVFLLTIVPSGFIGFVPIEAIKDQSMIGSLTILGFTFAYAYCAYKIFYRGLRRYASGTKPGFKV